MELNGEINRSLDNYKCYKHDFYITSAPSKNISLHISGNFLHYMVFRFHGRSHKGASGTSHYTGGQPSVAHSLV